MLYLLLRIFWERQYGIFVTYIYFCISRNHTYRILYSSAEIAQSCTLHRIACVLRMGRTEIYHIDDNFDDVGIQVNTFYKTYFCRENKTMENFRKVTNIENLVCNYKDVKEPIAKILFGSESDEEIKRIEKMLNSHPLANEFDFIRSEKTLYEILPKGIGKGTSITKLCHHLNIGTNKTIAVGDYNNDISMFKAAGIGIAVSNACKEALDTADYITVSNEEHAIARVINDLEKGKYKL